MPEITPTDGPGQFAQWKRNIERKIANLETMRRTPFTEIYDDDGNLLGKLSADGLQFFDTSGNVITDSDGSGLTVYDAAGNPLTVLAADGVHVNDGSGNEITTLDDDGLTIADNLGVAQLKAGNLDGAGDYGVEIGGGRARAIDINFSGQVQSDIALNTTEKVGATVTFTPPAWATETAVVAQMVFQMNNSSGVTQKMHFRIDVNGSPGIGLWSHWVANGFTANTSDAFITNVPGNSPFDVEAIVRVDAGTNNVNDVRIYAQATYLR